jgi:thioredoxin-like negative regulator of GroEL
VPIPIQLATPETFDALVTDVPEDLVVVYFWGPQCPNCEIFARDLPELLNDLPQEGIQLVKVNAYEHTELARRFGLFGIPGFVLFRRGKKLGMMRQYHGREYWTQVITEQALGSASV